MPGPLSLLVGIRVGDLNFVLQNRLYLINGLVEFEAVGSVFPYAADDRAAQTATIHTAKLGRFALEDVDIEGVRQRRLSINNTLDFTRFVCVHLLSPINFGLRAAHRVAVRRAYWNC